MRINPPVSEGKLDTSVNGPADDALVWDAIDWRFHEDNVRRLRQRIFTAARDGDLSKLRNLQITRKAIVADYLVHHGRSGPPGENTTRLAHATCQREHQARRRRSTALQSRAASRLA